MTDMLTRWGRNLDPRAILPQYPRPQLVRDSYLNLNGRWEYTVTAADAAEPDHYDTTIVVPFSPEAPLSGVGRALRPEEHAWYRRDLTLPEGFHSTGHRLLLHFGAVDQCCRVYCNGVPVGSHVGGYLPFHCDVTDALRPTGNTIVVSVRDTTDTGRLSRGKQSRQPGGIWYTAQSGIWQTVWVESVPAQHIRTAVLTPTPDRDGVVVELDATVDGTAQLRILDAGTVMSRTTVDTARPTVVPVPNARLWSPQDPHLYDVELTLGTDRVTSYFGMRTFGVGPDDDGCPRLLLNGRPYFHAGVLDQGYWPDGLYTAPSDEAMIADITAMKDLGFTMLRKHIKIEPLRWYHHCDRLGMLVWQDMVNGGGRYRRTVVSGPEVSAAISLDDRQYRSFARDDATDRARFRQEVRDTVTLLRNTVAVAVWVPFNEGWGQFDAAEVAAEVAALDPTRQVDHASGWHDQGAGDFRSLHVYGRRFRAPRRPDGRVLALTEYGGYGLRIPEHSWGETAFDYRGHDDSDALGASFLALHTEQVVPAIQVGLSATVYTQLSDVETEVNGLLSYDRGVVKIDPDLVRSATARLRYPGPTA